MGGKGGGGGPSYEDSLSQVTSDPFAMSAQKQQFEANKPKFASEEAFYQNYGIDPSTMRAGSTINDPEYKFTKDIFTKAYGTYQPPAPAPAPAPAAAPAPEPAAAPAPAAATPDTAAPTGPPADAGGPIGEGDGIGDNLSSAVLAPPKYWTGGYDSGGRNTKSRGGRMTTTQT